MAGFMSYIYPSDPNAVFKLSHFCAVWGYTCCWCLSG